MSDGATHGKKNLLRGARVTQIDKKARHVRNKKIVERGEGGGGVRSECALERRS